jgi:hypothetical protein
LDELRAAAKPRAAKSLLHCEIGHGQRSPRLGDANPTVLTNPLWAWMLRTRMNAYQGNQAWGGPSPFEAGPMWLEGRLRQGDGAPAGEN